MKKDDSTHPSRRAARGERRIARRKRIVFWSSALVLLVLVIAAAKPVYHWLKARRAKQLAAAAETLVHEGKLNEAAGKYRAALQLDPLGYTPLAGAARLATRGGRPEAADLWREVLRLPECTNEDRQEYAAFLLREGRLSQAKTLIEELLRTGSNAKTFNLAADYYAREGDEAKALDYARLAVARAPEDATMRFQLAELLAKSTDPARQTEARQILWMIAEKNGPLQRPAVEALARAPELPPEERQRVLAALEHLPERAAVPSLLAAELKLQMEPAAAEKIYDEAVAQWEKGEPADVAELARWLNLHKQFERVLRLLPPERVVAAQALLLSRLDALAGLARWPEIDAFLKRPDLGLDPSVTESFRARSAMGQGSTLDATLHWDRALELAKGDPFKIRFIAIFAEQSGDVAAALKAYDQLSRSPEHASFAQRGRQRLIERSGDAQAARNVAERLTKVAPDDVNAQAQLTHLNLLLGVEAAANLAKAKELVAKYPTRLSFRVTAALGFLRMHDAAGALAQFKGPAIEWLKTPPGWRAVYAAALLANEQEPAAREIIATIPRDRLNAEERALISPANPAP